MNYYHDQKGENEKYKLNSREEEEEGDSSSSSSSSSSEGRQLDCRDLTEEELTEEKIKEIIDFLKHTYGKRLEKAITEEELIKKIKEFKGNGIKIITYIYKIA